MIKNIILKYNKKINDNLQIKIINNNKASMFELNEHK